MAKSRSYQKDLLASLQDPDEAVEYLNAALEDGEPEVFLLALNDVVDSHGGMAKLATSTSLFQENLRVVLSSKGNPDIKSLRVLLRAMGMQLTVRQLPRKRVA